MGPAPLRRDLQIEQRSNEFLLSDPHQISCVTATLLAPHFAITQFFDGQSSIRELSAKFSKRYGFPFPHEPLEELVAQLSSNCLLDDDVYRESLADYRTLRLRPASCAGSSYPKTEKALRLLLEEQCELAGGPGQSAALREGEILRALVVPHIDLNRGGPCYSWGYEELKKNSRARTFVILGTSHYGFPGRFAMTRKDFETPLGTARTNQKMIDRLVELYGGDVDLFAGELAHKGEHSIEFQVLHLMHHFGHRSDFSIVPILCGSIHDLLIHNRHPRDDREFMDFVEALKLTLAGLPEDDAALVVGVDLSHLGEQYGQEKLTKSEFEKAFEEDQNLLALLCAGDLDALHGSFARDENARQVCGHAPLTALLALLEPFGFRGELLKHDAFYDGRSTVGFASVAFFESSIE
jgi:MEMO1 family protein